MMEEGFSLKKRKNQRKAALTNNQTPTESLREHHDPGQDTYTREKERSDQ
jgi:hypothetical protein